MTYCVAIKLDSGMLFASDSRTNAGVDHIATFSKMRIFEQRDERMFVILSSGNLAVTQGVMNILDRHKHFEPDRQSIWNVGSMFDVATLVGDALRPIRQWAPLRIHHVEPAVHDEDVRLALEDA